MQSFKNEFVSLILDLQNEICEALEAVDGKSKFVTENWERAEGGGGITRVMQGGGAFEKAGVNTSQVFGTLPQSMMDYLAIREKHFFATGISLVLHPENPFAPTVHANYRYFEVYNDSGEIIQFWFGGGSDLTPCYLFEEDAVHFHQSLKAGCDQFHPTFYATFKKQCDDYFYNHHRQEARGIGGIFFDRFNTVTENDPAFCFNFVCHMATGFLDTYLPIVHKRKDLPYTQEHKTWQELRRGRYVEFNLLHDKGTLFGLKTNGRIESILMSLPPSVKWHYNAEPVSDSEEEKMLFVLKNQREWISM